MNAQTDAEMDAEMDAVMNAMMNAVDTNDTNHSETLTHT